MRYIFYFINFFIFSPNQTNELDIYLGIFNQSEDLTDDAKFTAQSSSFIKVLKKIFQFYKNLISMLSIFCSHFPSILNLTLQQN